MTIRKAKKSEHSLQLRSLAEFGRKPGWKPLFFRLWLPERNTASKQSEPNKSRVFAAWWQAPQGQKAYQEVQSGARKRGFFCYFW